MTKEEAQNWLRKLYARADITDEYGDMEDMQPYEEAINMAILALSAEVIRENRTSEKRHPLEGIDYHITQTMNIAEPCEDAISRNDVIKMLNTMDRYTADKLKLCDTDKEFPHNEVFIVDDVYEGLDLLSSVQPKKGEWIKDEKMSIVFDIYRCSWCSAGGEPRYKFCPNCGADMRGKE